MAEADEDALPLLNLGHEGGHVLGRPNLHEHAYGALRGAAVGRAVERSTPGGNGAVRIDQRAPDLEDGCRGAVDFVVGVDDEQGVEGPLEHGVRAVLVSGEVVEQVEKVARVGQALGGPVEGPALSHAVRCGGERGRLADDAENLLVEDLEGGGIARGGIRVEFLALQRWVRFWGKSAQRGKGRGHHGHGVRVITEGLEHALNVAVDIRVVHDLILPALELRAGRQLAVDEQECGFEEVALVDELLDRVPSVSQDAILAINVGDFALDNGCVHVSRVVDSQALAGLILGTVGVRLRLDLLDVGGQDRVVLDGKLIAFASAVIHHRERWTGDGLDRHVGSGPGARTSGSVKVDVAWEDAVMMTEKLGSRSDTAIGRGWLCWALRF